MAKKALHEVRFLHGHRNEPHAREGEEEVHQQPGQPSALVPQVGLCLRRHEADRQRVVVGGEDPRDARGEGEGGGEKDKEKANEERAAAQSPAKNTRVGSKRKAAGGGKGGSKKKGDKAKAKGGGGKKKEDKAKALWTSRGKCKHGDAGFNEAGCKFYFMMLDLFENVDFAEEGWGEVWREFWEDEKGKYEKKEDKGSEEKRPVWEEGGEGGDNEEQEVGWASAEVMESMNMAGMEEFLAGMGEGPVLEARAPMVGAMAPV